VSLGRTLASIRPARLLLVRGRYQVRVDIVIDDATSGTVYVDVHPTWAPGGEARFRELLLGGWFDGCRFFRVIPGFMVQFGLAAEPAKFSGKIDTSNIKDDPVLAGNSRGRIVRHPRIASAHAACHERLHSMVAFGSDFSHALPIGCHAGICARWAKLSLKSALH
jgi:hypothetical protein